MIFQCAPLTLLTSMLCMTKMEQISSRRIPLRGAGEPAFGEARTDELGKPFSPNRLAKPAGVGKASYAVVRSFSFVRLRLERRLARQDMRNAGVECPEGRRTSEFHFPSVEEVDDGNH
jgi:hypothetical protein